VGKRLDSAAVVGACAARRFYIEVSHALRTCVPPHGALSARRVARMTDGDGMRQGIHMITRASVPCKSGGLFSRKLTKPTGGGARFEGRRRRSTRWKSWSAGP
jgi:hypothetical protein